MSSNKLTGTIPPISNLLQLNTLDLKNNDMEGTIPSGIFRLRRLAFLSLESNRFSGTIPPAIGAAEQLQEIRLDHNRFNGSLPAGLGLLAKLSILSLRNNSFTGTVPKTLAYDYAPAITRHCESTTPYLLRDAVWCLDVFFKVLSVVDVRQSVAQLVPAYASV